MEAPEAAITLVEPDWNAIQERYVDGESSTELAAEYGTTANAIRLRASKGRWKEKQLRRLGGNERELNAEVKGCLMISVLKEARMFRILDPSPNFTELDLASKARARLIEAAARLFGWDSDPVDSMKRVKCTDV